MVSLGRLLGHRETKSIGERKLALMSRIEHLKRELGEMQRQDYRQSERRTYAGRVGCAGLDEFDGKFRQSK